MLNNQGNPKGHKVTGTRWEIQGGVGRQENIRNPRGVVGCKMLEILVV